MAKIVKLDKNEDISHIIQLIKSVKDRDIIFEAEKGSAILLNSSNLRLVRKTAEVLGKTVQLKTDDATGKILATKAGMALYGDEILEMPKPQAPTRQTRSNKVGGFSDMRGAKRTLKPKAETEPASALSVLSKIPGIETAKKFVPKISMPTMTMNRPAAESSRWSRFGREYSKIFILVALVLAIAVFALAVLLPQAQITVYARSEPITRDMEITVDKNAKTIDSGKQIIPGEMVVKELSDTKTFQTTGTKQIGDKAAGSVVIYNFTKNTLTLKAATTVLTIGGKKYYFTKDAVGIRPTAKIGEGEDQEIDRSSLTAPIPVVAETPGEAFNLSANQQFQIVNSALGQNQNVYAINEVPISGGTTKTISILSQADLDRAVVQMTDELSTLAEAELTQDSNTADLKILPTGSTKEILAKTANKNVGDEAKEFDMTIIGRLSGLAYKEESIKSLMIDKISTVLSEDKYLLENGKKDVTARFKSLDLVAGRGILSVHFETVAAYRVSSGDLSKSLAGKTAPEIKEILLTKPEIDRVDVEFSPFFVHKAPKFNGKIYIKTQLSQD